MNLGNSCSCVHMNDAHLESRHNQRSRASVASYTARYLWSYLAILQNLIISYSYKNGSFCPPVQRHFCHKDSHSPFASGESTTACSIYGSATRKQALIASATSPSRATGGCSRLISAVQVRRTFIQAFWCSVCATVLNMKAYIAAELGWPCRGAILKISQNSSQYWFLA